MNEDSKVNEESSDETQMNIRNPEDSSENRRKANNLGREDKPGGNKPCEACGMGLYMKKNVRNANIQQSCKKDRLMINAAKATGTMWNRKKDVFNKETKIDDIMIKRINDKEPDDERHDGTLRIKVTKNNDKMIDNINMISHKNNMKDRLIIWGEENTMKVQTPTTPKMNGKHLRTWGEERTVKVHSPTTINSRMTSESGEKYINKNVCNSNV